MTPKQKQHKSATRSRRAHHALKPAAIRTDEDGTHLSHRAVKNDDGTYTYRGRTIGKKAAAVATTTA